MKNLIRVPLETEILLNIFSCILYTLQSGLLISVIRALSASETNEQREIEKAKLEKEYKRSDQRLEELVSSHDQDLMEVMQVNMDMFEFSKKLKYSLFWTCILFALCIILDIQCTV